MKILSAKQIREADLFTIKHEPISSIDLMERASNAFVDRFLSLFKTKSTTYIFCGTGNNGGDGLAIGRILLSKGWDVEFYVIGNIENGAPDFKTNLTRINHFNHLKSEKDFPPLALESIVIDGIFGSGLSRPVVGLANDLIHYLNSTSSRKVAIDIASGLYADKVIEKESAVFKPDYTISFQIPKLVFVMPEYVEYVGEWFVMDIGLSTDFIQKQHSTFFLTQGPDVFGLIPIRSKFDHKGKAGRLLLVAGSKGKMGAAVLCSRAALRSGVGLLTVHVPSCGTSIIQTTIPEAMVEEDKGEDCIIEMNVDTSLTVGIGPALGQDPNTIKAFRQFLKKWDSPLVIDADGINIIANNQDLLKLLPHDSILTPHPKEFERLVGFWENDFDKLDKLKELCTSHQLNVVLKGAFSAVCDRYGTIYFNTTGNPGMATAGSGDVLTGIISSLFAQGMNAIDALKLGVYIHGMAGDIGADKTGQNSMIASDIVENISKALLLR